MRYTENPPSVEALQWTKEIATAADKMNDARFPETEKKKFRDFDAFTADPRVDVDGSWLSVVDPHEGSEFGKYGVYCARSNEWKPLYVGSWVVCYDTDSTYDVFTADEFEAKFSPEKKSLGTVKKQEETK